MNVPTVTAGLKTLSALSFLIEITINHLFYVEVTTELKHETSGTAHIATITALSSVAGTRRRHHRHLLPWRRTRREGLSAS